VATPTATFVASNQIWATTLLVDAGLPTTSNNIDNVMRWMVNEEPASNWWDRNNPLNASLGTSASDGTGSYPSLTIGAQYTAAMLRQQNMAPIFNALAANAPPATFGAAVISSPWASSHYGGNVSRFTGAVPPVVTYTGQTLVASPGTPTPSNPTGAVQGAPGTCSANTGGLDIPGAGWIGTPCQIKAFTGGLLIGVGGFTLLVGAVLIASYGLKNTSVGAAVGKVAGGPVGMAAGVMTEVGRKAGTGAKRKASPTDRRIDAAEREQPTEPYASRQRRYKSEGFRPSAGDA